MQLKKNLTSIALQTIQTEGAIIEFEVHPSNDYVYILSFLGKNRFNS